MTRAKDISKILTAPVFGGLTYPTTDGSSNQFMKTDGSGNLSFSTVTGTTINNNADNRIITGSGSANTLEGEANLTFDGSTLGLTGNLTVSGAFTSQGIDDNADATAITIDSSERVGIGASNNSSYDANARNVLIADESGNSGLTIRSGGSSTYGMIHFADGVSSADEYRAGRIIYEHSSNSLQISTANAERMRIDSSGRVGIGVTALGANLNIDGASSDTWAASTTNGLALNGNANGVSTISTYADGSSVRIGSGVTQKTGITITGQSTGSGSTIQFRTGNSERMRIDSSGNVIIGETATINSGLFNVASSGSPNVLSLLCRSTTDSHHAALVMQKSGTNSGNFASTAALENLGSIIVRGVDTNGVSQIGGEIVVKQKSTASGSVPSHIFFNAGGGEKIRIGSETGQIRYNGVYVYYFLGSGNNNTTFSVDVAGIQSAGVTLVTAQYTHHSISSYGAARISSLGMYAGSIISTHDIQNITSSGGGSWSYSTPSSGLVRITKNAGSYVGGGHYWVKVETYYGN